jgi:hypothetical protein
MAAQAMQSMLFGILPRCSNLLRHRCCTPHPYRRSHPAAGRAGREYRTHTRAAIRMSQRLSMAFWIIGESVIVGVFMSSLALRSDSRRFSARITAYSWKSNP